MSRSQAKTNLVDVIDESRKTAPPTYEELLLENAYLKEELRKECERHVPMQTHEGRSL